MSALLEEFAPPPEMEPGVQVRDELSAADGPLVTDDDVTIDGGVGEGAEIRAGGWVRVGGDVTSADVSCAGGMRVKSGTILGGRVSAGGGLVCRAAGSKGGGGETELAIGFDEAGLDAIERRAAEIEDAIRRTKAFRAGLQPLIDTQRDLTPDQKEKLTDLMWGASQAEKRTAAAIREATASLDAMEARPGVECVVTESLHAGVTVRFPGVRAVIGRTLKGPVKLSAGRTKDGVRIFAAGVAGGKPRAIESVPDAGRAEFLRATLERLGQGLCR